MAGEPGGPGARPAGDEGDEQPTRTAPGRDEAIWRGRTGQTRPLADAVRPGLSGEAAPPRRSADAALVPTVMAGGEGESVGSVSPGDPGPDVERAWQHGRLPVPARRVRSRRLPGAVVTVALLAAAGVVLYLRLHHPPLRVTGVVISGQTRSGCGAVVTGRISTNGGAGVVSYRWMFAPGRGPEATLEQSVAAGERGVDVTAAIDGAAHGPAAQEVTLRVVSPGTGSASTTVGLSC